MAHVLAQLRNVEFSVIKNLLKEHAPMHAQEGMYLEHIWKNTDDPKEILFLFKTDNLAHARQYVKNHPVRDWWHV